MMNKNFLVVLLISMVSGCATNYSCSGYPDMPCASISGVYDRTKDGVTDYRATTGNSESKNSSSRKGISRGRHGGATHNHSSHENNVIQVAKSETVLNYVAPGDPILSEPRILRGLFFPWVDDDKDLQAGGYVYLRISEPKWIMVD